MKKSTLLFLICHLSLTFFCQEVIKGRWKIECGASTNNAFKKSSSINLRCLSPRFKYSSQEWTEEMEKNPEKYKHARLMLELMYMPPFEVVCTGANLQFRILKYKWFSTEVYGGMKFLLVAPPDFITNPKLTEVANKAGWYVNLGMIVQFNLGMMAPFADIGYDGIFTVGAELDFHAIYKKPKRRYRLRTVPVNRETTN